MSVETAGIGNTVDTTCIDSIRKWILKNGHRWFTAQEVARTLNVTVNSVQDIIWRLIHKEKIFFLVKAEKMKGRRPILHYKISNSAKVWNGTLAWEGRIIDAISNPSLHGRRWRVI